MLEKEIEDIIYDGIRESPEEMKSRGFHLPENSKVYRQVNLGDYGIADLIVVGKSTDEKEGNLLDIRIYELKREHVNYADLAQITKYMGGIHFWLESIEELTDEIIELKIRITGYLVAPASKLGLTHWLGDDIQILTVSFSAFTGVKFISESNYYHYRDCTAKDVKIDISDFLAEINEKKLEIEIAESESMKGEIVH